jgi:hypothetical protein
VAVARGVGDGVLGGGGAGLLRGQQFLRLQPIDGHGELPLVALHRSERRRFCRPPRATLPIGRQAPEQDAGRMTW